ncbi:MAG: carbon-nitrogen hydrolase [Tannerellaceae bacterium]|jgi:N-carbamoylputrescine amidase|nr:carbon-nitrogen hydrolase [Tannerellaceae bacterium]
MKLGIVQHAIRESREATLLHLGQYIAACAAEGAQVVILPELHNQAYFCQWEDPRMFSLAEPIPGPSTHYFGRLAATHNVTLVCSLFEKRAAGLYHNTAVVVNPTGTIAGIYRKMHIPDDPAYYEKFYFSPGDLGFHPIPTVAGTLGVLVCWDQWFPEAARLMALRGAEVLIYPTAIGWSPEEEDEQLRQQDAWITVQRGHAIANGLHLVAVNRTGYEVDPSGYTPGIHFWGSSFVAGPQGEILQQLPIDEEAACVIELDLQRNESVRHGWPFFRDRRIDAYEGITERFLG